MKTILGRIVATLIATAPLAGFGGVFAPNWYTDVNGDIQFFDSVGGAKLDSGFTVALGVFSSSVDFANYSTFAPSFTILGSSAWDPNGIDAGIGAATVSLSFDSSVGYPAGVTSSTQQIYAWVFDSQILGDTSHWSLITNNSWTLSAIPSGASFATSDWTITDAGTQYLVGAKVGNSVFLDTATAVPEPATYAAVLGSLVLGVVGYRRFRKR